MNDRHVAGDLGVYLAGALDRSERWAVETHLASCRWCANELTELREVTAMLENVPPEVLLDGPPEGGDLLLRRTVRQVRREGSGRGRRLASAAAAVVVAAAGVGGGFLYGQETAPTVTVAAPASAPTTDGVLTGRSVDGATGAEMAVAVVPATGWVRLSATIKGIPAGENCRIVVVGADGTRKEAGTWKVSEDGQRDGTTLDGSALVDPQDVRAVEVETDDGKRYVSVPV